MSASNAASSPDEWQHRLATLINWIEKCAAEFGWSTRQIEVRLTESSIGTYKAPALLIQEEAVRILVEPVARAAPGADGVVDLYLMPAYDDIASLYFYEGQWHIHYLFQESRAEADIREAGAKPLTEETLRDVLEAMKHNAVQ